MNWQTEEIFDKARQQIADSGVFSEDQIVALQLMIDSIEKAVEKESTCVSSSCASISR